MKRKIIHIIKSEMLKMIEKYRNYSTEKKCRIKSSKRIKSLSNGYVLTKDQEKEVLSFYSNITGGHKISLDYHNYYTEKTGVYYKEYIPNYFYYLYIDRYYNDATESKAFSNKCYAINIFSGMKMPKTVIRRINSFWYTNEGIIVDESRVNSIISCYHSFFLKEASYSSGGKGVYYLSDEAASIVEQFWNTVRQIDVDIIVQEPFKQHPALARVNESSVNTIRILTFQRKDGSVKICSAILRMGISGAKVDNASSGGITCGIDEKGHCKETGYYLHVNEGKRIFNHPTSDIPFKDIIIPNYDKVVDFVKQGQARLPHFRLISWDIAVGEDGEPCLIEANLLRGGIETHQVNNGPLFGEDTEEIIREVFSR